MLNEYDLYFVQYPSRAWIILLAHHAMVMVRASRSRATGYASQQMPYRTLVESHRFTHGRLVAGLLPALCTPLRHDRVFPLRIVCPQPQLHSRTLCTREPSCAAIPPCHLARHAVPQLSVPPDRVSCVPILTRQAPALAPCSWYPFFLISSQHTLACPQPFASYRQRQG